VCILFQDGHLRAIRSLLEGGSIENGLFEVKLNWLGCGGGYAKREKEE
jgi:hypothetical protein